MGLLVWPYGETHTSGESRKPPWRAFCVPGKDVEAGNTGGNDYQLSVIYMFTKESLTALVPAAAAFVIANQVFGLGGGVSSIIAVAAMLISVFLFDLKKQ